MNEIYDKTRRIYFCKIFLEIPLVLAFLLLSPLKQQDNLEENTDQPPGTDSIWVHSCSALLQMKEGCAISGALMPPNFPDWREHAKSFPSKLGRIVTTKGLWSKSHTSKKTLQNIRFSVRSDWEVWKNTTCYWPTSQPQRTPYRRRSRSGITASACCASMLC